LAQQEGLEAEVRSAGVAAFDGDPISRHSEAILRERGLPGEMKSSALSPGHIAWADLILTMTTGHKRTVIQRFPEAVDKTFTLKEYAEDDPAALSRLEEHRQLMAEIEMKQALGQSVTPDEYAKLHELESSLPDYDISDPFGGPLEIYKEAANEIEANLRKLIEKLKNRP
jgi:protein-tyrosine phosphatase